MKLPTGRNSWLITIGLAAVSIGYLYFIFLPTRRNIDKLEEQLSQKRAYLSQQPILQASLAASESELSGTEKYVRAWQQSAPAGELSSTYGRIHRLAKDAGVQLEKMDPQAVTQLQMMRRMPVILTAAGTFAELHALIGGLEQLPGKPWIESLRIERGKDAEAKLRGEITLVIFAANREISDYVKSADNR